MKKAIAALAIILLAVPIVFAGAGSGKETADHITSVAGYTARVLQPEQHEPASFDASSYSASTVEPTGQRHNLSGPAEVGFIHNGTSVIEEESEKNFFARVSLTPYSMGWYDFYRGHDIIGDDAVTGTDYGLTVAAEVGAKGNSVLSFFIGACYTQLWLSKYYLPDGHLMNHMQAYAGFDARLFSIGSFDFAAGLFGGAMLSINAGEGSWASLVGSRIHAEWNITDFLSVGLQSTFTVSYHPNRDPLYRSMSYTLDTAALTCAYRF